MEMLEVKRRAQAELEQEQAVDHVFERFGRQFKMDF
jgi:hypothetical protein